MHFFRSIRTKLTLWYASLVGISLVAFGASAYLFTLSSLSENLDRSLKNEVVWISELIEPKARKVRLQRSALQELQQLKKAAPPIVTDEIDTSGSDVDEIWNQIYQHTLLSPRKQFILIYDSNGDLLYRSPNLRNERLDAREIPFERISVSTVDQKEGSDLRVASTQNEFVKIIVAYPLEELNEVLDNIFSSYRFLAPLTLLISIVGGWFLADKSLKPVDTITRTARKISALNLTQRLPTKQVDDELGRLSATFNDMIARLEASFAQIQQFSADASHELRTPITIVRGEIELRKPHLPKSTKKLLTSILDELVRLSSIVESLMTLVRSESGRLAFQFEPVELHKLVRELAEDARVLAQSKRIKVNVDALDEAQVMGDASRLRQLLLNLLDNAVKYTPPRGTVTLGLTRRNGNALITVRDTGVGIPKKELPKNLRSLLPHSFQRSNEGAGERPRSRYRALDCRSAPRFHRRDFSAEKRKHVYAHSSPLVAATPLRRVSLFSPSRRGRKVQLVRAEDCFS